MKWKGLHIVLLTLLFSACGDQTNWRLSLDKNSTEPFGLYLAYNQLGEIFPQAKKNTIYDLQKEVTKELKKAYLGNRNNLLIIVASSLYLSREEVIDLHTYVETGGNVLLLSQRFSSRFDTSFNFRISQDHLSYIAKKKDSLTEISNLWEGKWYQSEMDMPFAKSYFKHKIGTPITKKRVNGKQETVMLEKFIGKGKIVVGLCPELLTNYAMLKDNNIQFYEQLLSRFNHRTNKILWFSGLTVRPKREGGSSNNSTLWKLLQKKPYRYAFLVMLLMALLFFAFETRRRQRIVEVVPPITNDSLAFTETIGKLYYGEKDNRNLAQKMIRYYLEYIRTTYNLNITNLNQELAEKLARKLNKTTEESAQFINYLNQQLTAHSLSETEIKELYQILKKYS